jgi:hypothetical protein
MDITRLLDSAFSLGRRHFGALLARSVAVAVPLEAAVAIPWGNVLGRPVDRTAAPVGLGFLWLFVWLVAPYAESATAGRFALWAWLGLPLDGGGRRSRAATVAVVSLLGGAIAFGPFALSVWMTAAVPAGGLVVLSLIGLPLAVVLGCVLLFAPLEAALGAGPGAALLRSARLMRGGFFRTLGGVLITEGVCMAVLSTPALFLLLLRPGAGVGLTIWMTTATIAVDVLTGPFRVAAVAALWFDLRARRHGLDLALRLEPDSAEAVLSR